MSDVPLGGTPYEILGVDRAATQAELRRAYRHRLRESHPDLGGDPATFHAVQLAWERIGTPRSRATYDNTVGSARPSRSTGPTGSTSTRAASPAAEQGPRVWATGSTAGSSAPPSRARSYGHPGGASRERYLTLIREWVGRGVEIPDPYADHLVRSAPQEIRHALADALAEEGTARTLATLGPAFTVWNDVAIGAPSGWASNANVSDPAKIDHVVLGPTGLYALQSEDWGGEVSIQRGDFVSPNLPSAERPMHALARRAKIARAWRTPLTALVVVLPDSALGAPVATVHRGGRWRPAEFAARASAVQGLLLSGPDGAPRLRDDVLFEWRTRLQQSIRFV